MHLEVLGIGNAFTSLHHHTSFLVRAQKTWLIDAPQHVLHLFRRRKIPPEQVDGVLLTHVHADHSAGVETFLLWRRYSVGKATPLYTSRSVFEDFQTKVFPAFQDSFTDDLQGIRKMQIEDFVTFHELSPEDPTPVDEEWQVEFRHNWHPVPTLGLKLHFTGKTVGISGDHCFRPSLLKTLRSRGILTEERYAKLAGDWLWKSDVIYHEASKAVGGPHTAEADLLRLPEEVRRKIRLIHLADDYESEHFRLAAEGERIPFGG